MRDAACPLSTRGGGGRAPPGRPRPARRALPARRRCRPAARRPPPRPCPLSHGRSQRGGRRTRLRQANGSHDQAACPLSTRGGTRLVRSVRGRKGGGRDAPLGSPGRTSTVPDAAGSANGASTPRASKSAALAGGAAPSAPGRSTSGCPRRAARSGRVDADAACPISTGGGTRRVRLVRGVGRGVSDQYGGRGGARPGFGGRKGGGALVSLGDWGRGRVR